MIYEAIVLYGLAVLILLAMWRRVKGKSLDQLVKDSHCAHLQVGTVFAKHPMGGTWKTVQKWMREAASTSTAT